MKGSSSLDPGPPGGCGMATHTAQVRIRVPPPPPHLHDPHLCEAALYETAAGSCLETALGAGGGRVVRGGTEGLYADTDRVLVSACSLDRPDDPAVFVAIRVEPEDHPTLSMGTRAEMAEHKAPPRTVEGTA